MRIYMPWNRRRILCALLAAAVLLAGGGWLASEELEVTFYHLYSPKIASGENIRVAVLSDLHEREFGPDNRELVERITALKPDLIAVAGDMMNAKNGNPDVILRLCEKLVKLAPVYYCPGNHESSLMYGQGSPIESQLLDLGVHVLVNRAEETTIHRTTLLIGGIPASPEDYAAFGAGFFQEYEKSGAFKLLIAHYPGLYYEALADGAVDLGICGHYHGGQVRLPLLGGLYHNDTGLFPKYSGGLYRLANGTLFVSRGMGGHNGLPRINNRPELAVIDINGRQEAVLWAMLVYRFLIVRAKLPGLRGGIELVFQKRRRLAVLGVVFFLVRFAARLAEGFYTPNMLMVFNYEEAARGQNPNVTRFNESDILSDHIMEQMVQRGDLRLSAEQLAECLTLSTPLDAEKLDVTQASAWKISTEYQVLCSEKVTLYHTTPKTVLNLLADVYWESFVRNYAENDSVLDLSFQELEGMEYLDVKDFLEMQARKLRNYLPGYSRESSSFRSAQSGETFASLSQKIENFITIELERYEAFVLEHGLSRDSSTYRSRMQYANRLLETDRRKNLAAHDVRIEAINMYDAFMTSFVLIPTYDVDDEFYMSRTKVGVDYFADEAKEHLASATRLGEAMEHNAYASAQVAGAGGNAVLEPFYREDRNGRPVLARKRPKSKVRKGDKA